MNSGVFFLIHCFDREKIAFRSHVVFSDVIDEDEVRTGQDSGARACILE
jgi:hypothetical protein